MENQLKSNEFWNQRYSRGGNSGYGSYGEQKDKKLGWLKGLDVKSIVDLGCGDFYFTGKVLDMYPEAQYNGYDTSTVIVERNRSIFPQYLFSNDLTNVPKADLVMCIDVLLHILDEDQLERTLSILDGYTKYLAVTAYEREEHMEHHVRIRTFDYKRFGEPIIREIVEEDGSHYFYLFKR